MPEDVGRDADLRGAGEEAVDLLAPRGERHRAVEHRNPVGLHPVDLTGEREHRLAAEGDENGAGGQSAKLPLADELERQLPLVHPELGVGKRAPHERERVERAEQPDVLVLPREQKLGPRGATLLVVCPLHLVEDEHLARSGAISTVQQRIGACSLIRSSPVTSPTRSVPTTAPSRRCASCASIRSGPA